MIRRPPRSTLSSSSAASDVYKRQLDSVPVALGLSPCILSPAGQLEHREQGCLRPELGRPRLLLGGLGFVLGVDVQCVADATPQSVNAVDALAINPDRVLDNSSQEDGLAGPVSYTHLTLPTKRIV